MRFIIGIDEVGRGCLAGPITVAVAAIPYGMRFRDLRDSKRFSALQRGKWLEKILNNPRIRHAKADASPCTIDRINVSQAANLAATRALEKLLTANTQLIAKNTLIFLDGGLFLRPALLKKFPKLGFATVIKADEKFSAVKIASIIAKEHRDGLMANLDARHPGYGLAKHKGYATKVHQAAVRKLGPSPIHRLTFLTNFINIA